MIPRYPGGKKQLAKCLLRHINHGLFKTSPVYVEPFVGGGGMLSNMRHAGFERYVLNDIDPSVTAVYECLRDMPTAFYARVKATVPSVSNFYAAKELLTSDDTLERAVARVCVHALSHGGYGQGPQGGVDQKGDYKIRSRWNPESWIRSWENLAAFASRWEIHTGDFAELETDGFCYADPPYFKAGEMLYGNNFGTEDIADHKRLKSWIIGFDDYVLSYDNVEPIRELYADHNLAIVAMLNGNRPQRRTELVISPEQ